MKLESSSIARISHRGARIARNVALASAAWLVFGTMFLVGVGFGAAVGPSVACSFVVFIVATVAGLAFRRGPALGVPRSGQRGAITVSEDAISVAIGERTFSASRVGSGFREEIGGLHQVILEFGERALCVRVRSPEEGEALLDACGVGVEQRAVTLRIGSVRSPIVRVGAALLTVLSVLTGVPSACMLCVSLESASARHSAVVEIAFAFFVVSAMVLAFSWNALAVRVIRIGRDGVLVRNGVLGQEFVPFDRLEVACFHARIELRTPTTRHVIKTASPEEAATVARRIESAARLRGEADRAGRSAILARDGRSLGQWERELRVLLSAPIDYRAPVDVSDLAGIVSDPGHDAEERVAAALVLSTLPPDAPERARVRVAIETTAEPRLRLALERACEGEFDDNVEHLARRD